MTNCASGSHCAKWTRSRKPRMRSHPPRRPPRSPRGRLRKMTDRELLEYGRAGAYMVSPRRCIVRRDPWLSPARPVLSAASADAAATPHREFRSRTVLPLTSYGRNRRKRRARVGDPPRRCTGRIARTGRVLSIRPDEVCVRCVWTVPDTSACPHGENRFLLREVLPSVQGSRAQSSPRPWVRYNAAKLDGHLPEMRSLPSALERIRVGHSRDPQIQQMLG
jgi:hypothetical protein